MVVSDNTYCWMRVALRTKGEAEEVQSGAECFCGEIWVRKFSGYGRKGKGREMEEGYIEI